MTAMTTQMVEAGYGATLRAARESKRLSAAEAAYQAREVLKRPISEKKILRLENGTTSETAA